MSAGNPRPAQAPREELDVISNRVAIALAKREKLIKSWTASSTREKEPEKTQEQLDAEDAALFRNEPSYLGVGAAIPSHFLISDAERNNKTLRAKFFPGKGLKASKQRDAEEKAASAKRGLKEESSDDEGGRSSLGKAKKRKISPTPKPTRDVKDTAKINEGEEEVEEETVKVLATTSITLPKEASEQITKESKEVEAPGSSSNTSEGSIEGETPSTPSKTSEEAKKEKQRLRKKMKKLRKQNREKGLTADGGTTPE